MCSARTGPSVRVRRTKSSASAASKAPVYWASGPSPRVTSPQESGATAALRPASSVAAGGRRRNLTQKSDCKSRFRSDEKSGAVKNTFLLEACQITQEFQIIPKLPTVETATNSMLYPQEISRIRHFSVARLTREDAI